MSGAGKMALGAVAGFTASALAVGKVVAIGKESIELFKEQEKAERLTEVAFGEGAEAIKDYASELQ